MISKIQFLKMELDSYITIQGKAKSEAIKLHKIIINLSILLINIMNIRCSCHLALMNLNCNRYNGGNGLCCFDQKGIKLWMILDL